MWSRQCAVDTRDARVDRRRQGQGISGGADHHVVPALEEGLEIGKVDFGTRIGIQARILDVAHHAGDLGEMPGPPVRHIHAPADPRTATQQLAYETLVHQHGARGGSLSVIHRPAMRRMPMARK